MPHVTGCQAERDAEGPAAGGGNARQPGRAGGFFFNFMYIMPCLLCLCMVARHNNL